MDGSALLMPWDQACPTAREYAESGLVLRKLRLSCHNIDIFI